MVAECYAENWFGPLLSHRALYDPGRWVLIGKGRWFLRLVFWPYLRR